MEWNELLRVLRFYKGMIFATAILTGLVSGLYAFLSPQWYTADALVAPVDNSPAEAARGGQLAALGGLAGLAGISINTDNSKDVAVAALSSRALIQPLMRDENLLPVLFSDQWDAERAAWKSRDPKKIPTLLDGYTYFTKSILKIVEEKKKGLVTISVQWKSPELAAHWTNELVKRANDSLRQRALDESEHNQSYLQQQAQQTSVVELRQAIYALTDVELRKAMVARGNDQYAFRVIDPAVVPEKRSWPKRKAIVLLGVVAGAIVGLLMALLLSYRELNRRADGI